MGKLYVLLLQDYCFFFFIFMIFSSLSQNLSLCISKVLAFQATEFEISFKRLLWQLR